MITFFVVLFGIYGTKNLLREDAPTVDLGRTKITTIYQGATAEEVETEITKKLEESGKKATRILKMLFSRLCIFNGLIHVLKERFDIL